MVKLMDLIVEKTSKLLSNDEKVLINKYLRSGHGNKAGDLSSHLVEVGYSEDYKSTNAKNAPHFKKGPAKGLPMINKDGYSRVLRYKGEDIFWEKDGPFVYPKDIVSMLKKAKNWRTAKHEVLKRYNGGFALVKDKPYDAKLKAVLAHAASKTVKGHWVEETPLSTIKKLGK